MGLMVADALLPVLKESIRRCVDRASRSSRGVPKSGGGRQGECVRVRDSEGKGEGGRVLEGER